MIIKRFSLYIQSKLDECAKLYKANVCFVTSIQSNSMELRTIFIEIEYKLKWNSITSWNGIQ